MTTEEKAALVERYAIGTRVLFRDANATVSDGVDGVRTGVVNGPIWFSDDEAFGEYATEECEPLRLLVWASRDKGREATTIMVAWGNVVGPCSEQFPTGKEAS